MLGERALSYAIQQYLAHYHAERNHQGLANQRIAPELGLRSSSGQIRCCDRLGGLRRYYYRDAALFFNLTGSYAIGTSTTLESNESLERLLLQRRIYNELKI